MKQSFNYQSNRYFQGFQTDKYRVFILKEWQVKGHFSLPVELINVFSEN